MRRCSPSNEPARGARRDAACGRSATRSRGGPALAPQPSLSRIDTLVAHARETGLPVDLEIEGEPVPLPAGVELTAYRLVQEGLTNTIKHASAKHADVRVRYDGDHVEIEVCDDGREWTANFDGRQARPGGHARARVDLRRRARSGRASRGRVPTAGSAPGGDVTLGVLIADDQALMRAGFRMILAAEPDLEVVGEATTGHEAVAEAGRLRPDVVLMDVRMPEMDGIEATRRLLDGNGDTKVVMLTTFDMDEYVYEAFRAGASGFLVKDVPPEQLIAGIRSGRVGRRSARPVGDPAPDPGVRAPAAGRDQDAVTGAVPADGTGGGGPRDGGARTVQRRDRHRALRERDDGEDTRRAPALEVGVRDRVQAVVFAYESGVVAPSHPPERSANRKGALTPRLGRVPRVPAPDRDIEAAVRDLLTSAGCFRMLTRRR